MPNISIATIDNPEFINLQPLDISPLMSKCEIKVLYIGQNRNRSYITKEVAIKMSKTLRGAPIVGWFKEEKGDFIDHGDRLTLDGEGFKFECMTKPYGFVAPDAEVWFQNFEDTDEFGNKIVREYLMTTGYLWTEQYKEAKLAIENGGRPHSMELDNDSLDGHWSEDSKTGLEFFIINDAIFSKLCILGENVEPCFEGSKISTPEVSKTFNINNDFKNTLFAMMQDLKFALQGGQTMKNIKTDVTEVTTPVVEFSATQGNIGQNIGGENQKFTETTVTGDISTEFKDDKKKQCAANAKKDDNQDPHETHGDAGNPHNKDNSGSDNSSDEEGKKNKDKNYKLLVDKFEALEQKYAVMEKEYQNLINFKNEVDNEKKDALIKTFYMLSDEDKKEIIENKAKYSLEEIESKLSVICFRKKVSFEDVDKGTKQNNTTTQQNIITYSLNNEIENDVPAWVQAARAVKNKQK